MCGITGGWWRDADSGLESRLEAALRIMHMRGPDDQGYELSPLNEGMVALGHTRLSIIDLSAAGHQPMLSPDGRYAIVFNGEIYNYRELRDELRGLVPQFVSDSDTEVLLHAWIQWGVRCLTKLEGMFAFAVYDRQEKTLNCARDAFGIKPFFYAFEAGHFAFASEHPALLALRGGRPKADLQRSYDYLVHDDYDSNNRTFIDGVFHLPPAHWLTLDLSRGTLSEPKRWWQPNIAAISSYTFEQAAEAVRQQFLHNVRLHLRSDVPLGVALSGGIDSSAVVCAMRRVEPDAPIHTFSFIARDSDVSEEHWVDHINAHVGAIPHKVVASGQDLARDIDDMILAQGEPFGSTSMYAQYRVFQLAKESGITVTLEGQGADELIAGYFGYPGHRLLSLLENGHPLAALRFAQHWSKWPGRSYKLAWMNLGRILLPDTLYKMFRRYLGRNFSPPWLKTDMLLAAGVNLNEHRVPPGTNAKGRRVIEELANSLHGRMLPALLRHADRNSMHFSVESRVPFLTIPFAELVLSLPEHYLISPSGETKSIFRAAMRGIVPDDVLNRKDKIGFQTPENAWLRGIAPTIRQWLQASSQIPFVNRDVLLKSFEEVVSGRIPFRQAWRWINYVRWYQHMNVAN